MRPSGRIFFTHMKPIILIAFVVCTILTSNGANVKVIQTDTGYTFLVNNKPYYVRGVGGTVHLPVAASIGANSIRTWGVDDAQKILDEAHKYGLTVMLGMWLQHERHGFDYNNVAKVQNQFNHFKDIVNQFKNHPALLMWGIGNELDLNYSNTNVWFAVQDLAKYIHEVDTNHPTSTVTAGLDSLEVQLISSRCPDIDVYCINTYGDIGNVPKNIQHYGWNGPYMITEWGPNGHWESPTTQWGVSIEQTSSEKRQVYQERYQKYIWPNRARCLGSYAFLWGAKQEYTETWYGLFSKDDQITEPVDALEIAFKGIALKNPAPSIDSFTMNQQKMQDNVLLKTDFLYTAQVYPKLLATTKSVNLSYTWRIIQESTDKKSGGDFEQYAEEISGLIKQGKTTSKIAFRAPRSAGEYRLFVTIKGNQKVAYANFPFKVIEPSKTDKPSRLVKWKHTDINDFYNP